MASINGVIILETDPNVVWPDKNEQDELIASMERVGLKAIILPPGLKASEATTPLFTDRVTFTQTYEEYTITIEGSLDRSEVKTAWDLVFPPKVEEENKEPSAADQFISEMIECGGSIHLASDCTNHEMSHVSKMFSNEHEAVCVILPKQKKSPTFLDPEASLARTALTFLRLLVNHSGSIVLASDAPAYFMPKQSFIDANGTHYVFVPKG